MQRKFVVNLMLVLAFNLLVKLPWLLGIDVAIQNRVGVGEYGMYYALLNLTFLFNIFLDLGVTNFNTTNIARYSFLVRKHFSNLVGLKLLLGVVYVIITLVAAFVMDYSSEAILMLSFLSLNQFLVSFILYCRSNLAGLLKFGWDNVLSVLDRAILIGICSYLLWGIGDGDFKITWLVYAQTGAYSLAALVALILVLREVKVFKPRFRIAFNWMILRKSLPFASMFLLMMLYNRLDSVMLERMLDNGDQEAGIYAQGYRFFEASNMMAYLFAGLLLPIFSRLIGDRESVEPVLRMAHRLMIVPALLVAFIGYAFGQQIVDLFYTFTSERSVHVFSGLLVSFIPVSMSYVYGTLLTANHSLKAMNIIAVLGVACNLILNFILIPIHGAEGAVVATLATQLLTFGSQYAMVRGVFKYRVPFTDHLKVWCYFLVLVLTFFLVNQSEMFWTTQLFIVVGVGLIGALILKLIDANELLQLLKNRVDKN